MRDDKGRTPLHIAASLGYLEEAPYLLPKHALNATQRDKTSSFPIHLASNKGHVDVIILLLQYFPDLSELPDRDGCNILHVAAKSGRFNVLTFVLKNPDMEHLINMKDKSGNTPLHLATMHWHPKIVNAFAWDKRVDIKAFNNSLMSALDVAEQNMPNNPQFRERLTWAVLNAAGTPRYLSKHCAGRDKGANTDNYKDRVNTLLLVATLVATVTFAAGFTMPGGNNSSEKDCSNLGMANMVREKGFHVFVVCNIIGMHSSIIAAAALIWAQEYS